MEFRLIKYNTEICGAGFYLIHDNWDDWFEYEISYELLIKESEDGEPFSVGRVKIARRGQTERYTQLPDRFEELGEEYVSVGFEEDYYENLKKSAHREEILTALRDIAYYLDLYELVKNDNVTRTALMREYTEVKLKRQIHRMAQGGARLTQYDFTYVLPSVDPNTGRNVRMDFEVEPDVKPTGNIHVLVGKNGIGKTTIIKKMIYALERAGEQAEVGKVENSDFANIVYVSFSVFDNPVQESDLKEKIMIPYKFVGVINSNKTVKSSPRLTDEFVEISYNFYENSSKMRLWKETIEILEADRTFEERKIGLWVSEGRKKEWITDAKKQGEGSQKEYCRMQHREEVTPRFSELSSGHKIILLTLANLIDLVEEKTIVFMDEPEEHLHPPLVAAFMNALSNLLTYRNGVGIIATHSPVIVQEVPKRCVWILKRAGEYLLPIRPQIETYGENLGELTTEIFRYEVDKSGFHKELLEAAGKYSTYEQVKKHFGGELGKEAKSILRSYMYDGEEDKTTEC